MANASKMLSSANLILMIAILSVSRGDPPCNGIESQFFMYPEGIHMFLNLSMCYSFKYYSFSGVCLEGKTDAGPHSTIRECNANNKVEVWYYGTSPTCDGDHIVVKANNITGATKLKGNLLPWLRQFTSDLCDDFCYVAMADNTITTVEECLEIAASVVALCEVVLGGPLDELADMCAWVMGRVFAQNCVLIVEMDVTHEFTPDNCAYWCDWWAGNPLPNPWPDPLPDRRRLSDTQITQQCSLGSCSGYVKSRKYSKITSCNDLSNAQFTEEAHATNVCDAKSKITCNSTHVVNWYYKSDDCSGDPVAHRTVNTSLHCKNGDGNDGSAYQFTCVATDDDVLVDMDVTDDNMDDDDAKDSTSNSNLDYNFKIGVIVALSVLFLCNVCLCIMWWHRECKSPYSAVRTVESDTEMEMDRQ